LLDIFHHSLRLHADPSRVVVRPFHIGWSPVGGGTSRTDRLVRAVLAMSAQETRDELEVVLKDFEARHWQTRRVFMTRYDEIEDLLGLDGRDIGDEKRQLIGAYFCHEYSYAAAALMNPSAVPHFDQTGMPKGSMRILMSLRSVGEGHISSVAFREGIITLREMGVLMTAIIVAGRSGSAFTAHIGSMRVNQEIDAMQTMGLNTVDTLVLPRIIGLVVALPLLTLYADIMGLMGGAIMCYFDLGVTFPAFMRELQQALEVKTLLVGLVKAPVFAFVIALVGCYEGFQVERNAASVGLLTTRSVVESVFLVIVLDAAFSVMFSVLGI